MKSRNKIILLADNDPRFARVRAEFLEANGYQVFAAFTLEDANDLLRQAYIHLALLDIRLVDNDDEKDVSGLNLAKDPAYRSIPKIIFTDFPTIESVKDALSPRPDGFTPAVDYIDNKDGPDAMIRAVEEAFAKHVHINWDLEIQLNPSKSPSFPQLAHLIAPNPRYNTQALWPDELDDLFRKLFNDEQKIRLSNLLWSKQNQFCLSVLVRSPQGLVNSYLVICSSRENSDLQSDQVQEFPHHTGQMIRFLKSAETIHFHANIYSLPGADIETMQSLRNLLQMGRERSLKTVFTHLLGDALAVWSQKSQIQTGKQDLLAIYRQWVGLTDDKVFRTQLDEQINELVQSAQALSGIEIKRENERITFHFPHHAPTRFPDPLATVYSSLLEYHAPIVCRISPRNLKLETILVDLEQRSWLTDFASAGASPQWWKFVCLEAEIRFETYQAPDLIAWQEFEECLARPKQLDEKLEQNEAVPELRIAISLIEQVRRQAASVTGSDSLPYHMGLLVWVMDAISHHDPDLLPTKADQLRNAHLLLAASILAEQITQQPTPEKVSANTQLKLDDDDKLWIGDRCITFSGLRLKLLRYLYQQAGKTVSISAIVEKVYDEKYDPNDREQQNQRIRQEINRLREVIEPRSGQQHYIVTEREKGYCLYVAGKPRS